MQIDNGSPITRSAKVIDRSTVAMLFTTGVDLFQQLRIGNKLGVANPCRGRVATLHKGNDRTA